MTVSSNLTCNFFNKICKIQGLMLKHEHFGKIHLVATFLICFLELGLGLCICTVV